MHSVCFYDIRVDSGGCWEVDQRNSIMRKEGVGGDTEGGSGLPGNRGVRTSAPPKVICRDVNTIQPAVICYVHQCLCVAKFSF